MKKILSILIYTVLFSTINALAQLVPGQSVVYPNGKTVTYHLSVGDTIVTHQNHTAKGLATNGQIPAPTLEFTEGDTALIYVHNNIKGTISFHWHGILLPNRFDGVPLLTTELIEPGETHIFKFPIIQN
ncbi:MAG: multicopper oxidase domain-containing protein, partial [Hymenobacteraceae bacterium]|nr:multicopper oxidase domain-containing protein [Hymenobacteraceae bacterium]MDX5396178.1 multicopper oxidase domain-containing protein [Hymenobacteraceae bacterium]MDX5512239.1 multicopper oxidase domain-containing protein [Hymenobacteraceae bacterium]